MKKGKDEKKISKWREALFDGVGEIVFTLIFLGIGFSVFALLGLDFDWEKSDPDILILVGIAVIAIVVGTVFVGCGILKRIKKKEQKGIKKSDDKEGSN